MKSTSLYEMSMPQFVFTWSDSSCMNDERSGRPARTGTAVASFCPFFS